jgi:hypothetical protein
VKKLTRKQKEKVAILKKYEKGKVGAKTVLKKFGMNCDFMK